MPKTPAQKLAVHNWYKKKVSESPWWRTFVGCRSRCNNPKHRYYRRGIKFEMTLEDFKFLWFRDKAYELKEPSIDRIDNLGNYALNNCRYIENLENNKRPKMYLVKKVFKNAGWARYGKCIACGTTDKPYLGMGLCTTCYGRIKSQKKRAKSKLRCTVCNSILRRMNLSSEPEGIRKDAYCRTCKVRYMVTKSMLIEFQLSK